MRLAAALATFAAFCALALVVAYWGWQFFGPAPVPVVVAPPANPVAAIVDAHLFGASGSQHGPAAGATLPGDARLLGIIATPNCATTPVVMALWPVHRVNPVKRIVAATYQSVSGTGGPAVTELRNMTREVLDEQPVKPEVYPHQIAFNLIPEIGSWKDDDYTSEEMKLVNETRKIFHEPDIAISATCVRVPTFVSHAAAVFAELSEPMAPDKVRAVMASQPGVVIQDDPRKSVYPQPWDAAGKDPVFVGRIREDISHPRGLDLWIVADNIRKGAALNAVQIAEILARTL